MSRSPKTAPPKDFESAIAELETLVDRLESGQMSLEDSLTAYQRGMELTRFCEKTLNAAEQQVKRLENGTLKDFHPEEGDAV